MCNFAAYGFVPATLVTPLGALSVLVSAVMSTYFLNEKLNTIGKIGCFLTAIGSTVMVIHAPKEGEIKTVYELLLRLKDPEFLLFTILCIISLLVLIFVLAPKHGNTNILIYILICSILGSFTVMSCKGLSLGIKEMLSDKPSVSYFFTYMFAVTVITCIIIQMNYLNKSLDVFNTPIVTTVYYVLFTLFVMIASSILFKELLNVSFQDFVGCMCGFSTIVSALCLIHFFKTTDNQPDKFNNLVLNMQKTNDTNDFLNNSRNLLEKQVEMGNSRDGVMTNSQFKEENEYLSSRSADGSFRTNPTVIKINDNLENPVSKNLSNSINMSTSLPASSSFITRLTTNYNLYKNMPKNYFKQIRRSTDNNTKYNYNALQTNDDIDNQMDQGENDDVDFNSGLNDNKSNYVKVNTNDFDDSSGYPIQTSKTLNSILKPKANNRRVNSKPNKSKNLSFDERFFDGSDKEDTIMSTSLTTYRS